MGSGVPLCQTWRLKENLRTPCSALRSHWPVHRSNSASRCPVEGSGLWSPAWPRPGRPGESREVTRPAPRTSAAACATLRLQGRPPSAHVRAAGPRGPRGPRGASLPLLELFSVTVGSSVAERGMNRRYKQEQREQNQKKSEPLCSETSSLPAPTLQQRRSRLLTLPHFQH